MSAITKMFLLPTAGGARAQRTKTDIRLPYIASRLFNNPLAITEEKLQDILAFFVPRIEGREGVSRGEIIEFFESTSTSHDRENEKGEASAEGAEAGAILEGSRTRAGIDPGYDILSTPNGNIAVVPIAGTLVQRGAWVRESSGMTSYQGIRQAVSNALVAPNVDALLLYINSPGGEVFGCFDLAFSLHELVRNPDQAKPIFTFTDGLLASAAYAIGSVSERVYGDMTSFTGSIGVITVHMDVSKANENKGIKVTQLAVGARKTDYFSGAPLSDGARAAIMSRLEATNDVFVNHVAIARPMLTRETILGYEAGVFVGQSAVDRGLLDGIKTFGQVVEDMQEKMQEIKEVSKTQTQVSTQLDEEAVHLNTSAEAIAAGEAETAETKTEGEFQMAEQAESVTVTELNSQLGALSSQIGELLRNSAAKDEKIDALLNKQNEQSMREFVNAKLRYVPGDAAHVTSILLRLNDLDPTMGKEVAQLLMSTSAVMETTGRITTSIGQYGHQHEAAAAVSEDGRVRIEQTAPMEAFKAKVSEYRVSHSDATELGAWDAVADLNPDLYLAVKNGQEAAPEVIVTDGPAQMVGADMTGQAQAAQAGQAGPSGQAAAAAAVPALSGIGAEYMAGATAGPDVG